ncbi:MAG: bipartite response regulator [Candidatus Pelagibacter sp.]|nr:bipartite response regulator [Candidatus Pelagibacter sp.]|tara:strand:+ start:21672 stop:22304 length:633 start_codon:yes stop_codon:yes gene_type:complete
MHKNLYSVNVACICSENFIKSFEEVKSFFSFNLFLIEPNSIESANEKYDAIIIESTFEKKVSLEKINIPKILIGNKNLRKNTGGNYQTTLKLPINILKFNQEIIDLCKKSEFGRNSLIKVKDYILDKNERVLKKGKKILKITEKEIHFINMLHNSKKPLSKKYILENIWSYSSDAHTHTVETHIYRLRQKIKQSFNDDNFIQNSKDGYSL